MRREDLTIEDKKIIDDAVIIEDLMINNKGYNIIKDWLVSERRKAVNIKALDIKKTGEELKVQIAINQTKIEMIDNLEKFLIRKIEQGKELNMQLLVPGQGEEVNERI